MKKILIITPFTADRLIASFSLLKALCEKFHDDDLHVIFHKAMSPYMSYLKGVFQCHEIAPEELTITSSHKYAVNKTDIFNIDVSFDLEGSGVTGCLQLAFRAKKNFTLAKTAWNPIKLLSGMKTGPVNDMAQLLAVNLDVPIEELKTFSKEGKEYKKEQFISIFFQSAQSFTEKIHWLRPLLSHFSNCAVGIFINKIAVGDTEKLQLKHDQFLNDLKVGFKFGEENWNLPRTIFVSSMVLTDVPWLISLCTYFGLESVYLGKREELSVHQAAAVMPEVLEPHGIEQYIINGAEVSATECADHLDKNLFSRK
jgi:hypothetical protein